MSAAFWNGILADHAVATAYAVPPADKHPGWEIDRDFLGHWRAVHPSFDGESNTVQLTALTRRDLIAEIDLWIEENEESA